MARRRHHRRRSNPSLRHRRHRRLSRRNPPQGAQFALLRPGTLVRPAVIAGGSALVSAWAPSVVVGTGASSNQAYATQFATALLLGALANWWGGPRDAIPAFTGGAAPIIADFTRRAIAGVAEASVTASPSTLQAYTSGRLGDLYYGRTFMPRARGRVQAYPVPGPTVQSWARR
jgi:hypothetical protein